MRSGVTEADRRLGGASACG